jgi:hypothetical protein
MKKGGQYREGAMFVYLSKTATLQSLKDHFTQGIINLDLFVNNDSIGNNKRLT